MKNWARLLDIIIPNNFQPHLKVMLLHYWSSNLYKHTYEKISGSKSFLFDVGTPIHGD